VLKQTLRTKQTLRRTKRSVSISQLRFSVSAHSIVGAFTTTLMSNFINENTGLEAQDMLKSPPAPVTVLDGTQHASSQGIQIQGTQDSLQRLRAMLQQPVLAAAKNISPIFYGWCS
jgi:hypothetical protein